MIRTRDLVLFILVLFFLGTAITATITQNNTTATDTSVVFKESVVELEASSPDQSLDRKSNIARLRTKLAESTQIIKPAASVESPEEVEIVGTDTSRLQKCVFPDDALSMVPKWPLSDVKVEVREGARVVYYEEVSVVPKVTASSTYEETLTITTPLLQLPLLGTQGVDISCVPSEVVGVTSGGVLMFNGDVNSYRKIPSNARIGYARDGFPIYGVYDGEVDACGGYDAPDGYRYTISTERDYIVGCYVGDPQKFSL